MKGQLLEVLACPVCQGDLELEVAEEEGGEIVSGFLTCPACRHTYPVSEGIPCSLPSRREENDALG